MRGQILNPSSVVFELSKSKHSQKLQIQNSSTHRFSGCLLITQGDNFARMELTSLIKNQTNLAGTFDSVKFLDILRNLVTSVLDVLVTYGDKFCMIEAQNQLTLFLA